MQDINRQIAEELYEELIEAEASYLGTLGTLSNRRQTMAIVTRIGNSQNIFFSNALIIGRIARRFGVANLVVEIFHERRGHGMADTIENYFVDHPVVA